MKIVNTYYKIFLVVLSLGLVTACNYDDDYDAPDYVTFEYAPGGETIGVPVGGTASYEATVYTADVSGQDRTYNIVTGGTAADAVEVPGSVTIPAGENSATVMVNASDVGLGVTGQTLTLNLEETGEYSVGAPLSFLVARSCPGSALTIAITFDQYSGETGWRLEDSDGNLVIEVEGGDASASRSLCVPNGTYTFTLTDSYGDGIVNGGATISYAGEEIATVSGDFEFESSVEITF